MPKNIVLCFDGTWNTPSQSASPEEDNSTNVYQFFQRVNPQDGQGRPQIKWYNRGVGTEWMNRLRGGAFGLGLDEHIKEGYTQLIRDFEPGDNIFILGFSRGAYTARSLVGMVRNVGLLRTYDRDLLETAYSIYRSRDEVDSEYASAFRNANCREITITFVGVWDTVGALGVPLRAFNGFDAAAYGFHDTKLSSIVQNAFHALAVDEHRAPYAATLWGPQDPKAASKGQVLEQVWFPGAHADVGGGYPGKHAVSDLTLRWMQKKAESCGLGLQIAPAPDQQRLLTSDLHDSFREFLGGVLALFSERHYRPLGLPDDGPQLVDQAVRKRLNLRPDYRPKNPGLFDVGETGDAW